jgi:phosphate transport system substrate-binding protein
VEHAYPLTRTIPAVIDRAPCTPVDPKVREFLRYTLSVEGQAPVLRDGGYLPLDNGTLSAQLRKLDP